MPLYPPAASSGEHPDLATHDALGLATDTELSDHAAAADPHTGYRLESADHTHASSGAQGGTIDHGALTGLSDDDHPQYVLESLFDAKGDLIAASADNTPAKVTVGANNTILVADSGQTAGVKWLATGYGITAASHAVGLTSTSAFATAETTISAATYADITGCSVSLDAGTWLVFGHVIARAVNAIIQVFVAITDGANAVISESAISRPASGTANLNAPISVSWFAIVSPGATTTYKLRGARGLTTHTGSWIAMDGNGVNTTNHASNNTDKGTGIFAVQIA